MCYLYSDTQYYCPLSFRYLCWLTPTYSPFDSLDTLIYSSIRLFISLGLIALPHTTSHLTSYNSAFPNLFSNFATVLFCPVLFGFVLFCFSLLVLFCFIPCRTSVNQQIILFLHRSTSLLLQHTVLFDTYSILALGTTIFTFTYHKFTRLTKITSFLFNYILIKVSNVQY